MTDYSKYIVTGPKSPPPEVQAKFASEHPQRKSTIESTHLLSVDSEIIPDMFYVDCVWLWKGQSKDQVEKPHTHDFDEVIAFIGSDRDKPRDLGGEISIWLDGEKHILDKTCLIFVPAGAEHCPVVFNRIDRPVFWATISPSSKYTRTPVDNPKKSTGTVPISRCRVITEVVQFDGGATDKPPAPPPDSTVKGARVMHLEDHVAQGSFYVDFVWIYEGTGQAPAPEHNHDWVEVIAMIGADPQHPRDLGGTMSIVLGGETQYIRQSSLVCIPKGLKHCPWKFLDIKKPTLVFTAGPSGKYTGSHRQ
jgi:hypothetical protein